MSGNRSLRRVDLHRSLNALVGPFFAGFLRLAIALLAVGGLVLLILLTLLAIEGWGPLSVVDLGAEIATTSEEDLASRGYTGHLLSVVILSLTAVALLASAIGVAATMGLIAHARALRRDIQDEIVASAHRVFGDLSIMENAGVQAKTALDTAVYEWQARSLWSCSPEEKRRSIVRAHIAVQNALAEIENAHHRLLQIDSSLHQLDAVREHITRVRHGLDKLEANIKNAAAFFLAMLYEEGFLDDEDLVHRGLMPPQAEAVDDAVEFTDAAVAFYDQNGHEEGGLIAWLKMKETSLFVHDRMQLEDRASLRQRFSDLDSVVRKNIGMARTEREKTLSRWWEDRQSDYSHLEGA